jgi:hypothetical protein
MLKLVFTAATAGKPVVDLGPMPAFRIEGELMRNDRGEPIARHTQHHWETGGGKYFRIDVPGPVTVRFFDLDGGRKSDIFGPFEHFSCADGIAYADREVFASLTEAAGHWHCTGLAEDWPAFEISAA